MGNWVFSAAGNTFYPVALKDSYISAGTWPADEVDVSDEDYSIYSGIPPAGKVLGNMSGYPAWVDIIYDPEQTYKTIINTLINNTAVATSKIKVPYSFEEESSWWTQVYEAISWTENNSYVPVMLNAMVSASGGYWNLPDLSATILSNFDSWRSGTGNILGQLKAKRAAVDALKLEVDAGTADVHLLVNFDCTVLLPAVGITDKYA